MGKPYTRVEKNAAEGKIQLTKDDPLPETLYRLNSPTGEPLAVRILLSIENTTNP